MAKLLLLESSTTNCSVGLAEDGKLIDLLEKNEGYTHSEHMASFVQEILERNNVAPSELEAVAVGKGPGSYTGLRIGVSLAKGIAYGQNIPLISLESLQVIAKAAMDAGEKFDQIVPMIDARRMEVYTCGYDSELKRLNPIEAKILDEQSFETELKTSRIVFCGDGSHKFKASCKSKNAIFLDDVYPSTKYMSQLAYEKFRNAEFEDSAYFEPYYLKEFIALKPKKPI